MDFLAQVGQLEEIKGWIPLIGLGGVVAALGAYAWRSGWWFSKAEVENRDTRWQARLDERDVMWKARLEEQKVQYEARLDREREVADERWDLIQRQQGVTQRLGGAVETIARTNSEGK